MGKKSQVKAPKSQKEGVGKHVLLHCLPDPVVDVAALANDLARDIPVTVLYDLANRQIEFFWSKKLPAGRVEVMLGACRATQCSRIEYSLEAKLVAGTSGVDRIRPQDARQAFASLRV